MGIAKRQVDGLRITDEPTLDVVVGVLAGLINTRLVAALGAAGVRAVGLTGADAGVGRVRSRADRTSPPAARPSILDAWASRSARTGPRCWTICVGKVTCRSCRASGPRATGELFNVNADTLAAHLAARLKSPRLVIAGATAGVLDERGGTIADLSFEDIAR